MNSSPKTLIIPLCGILLVVGALAALTGITYVVHTGLRGQPQPGQVETRIARAIRSLAVPGDIKSFKNPLGNFEEVYVPGMEHFAKYCAMCHGNNGSGKDTKLGGGLYPKPLDLRSAATQGLTDGEIFWVIENGVRFTGMPAFGTGTGDPSGEELAWQLVSFVRHLPHITADELAQMEALNPL